MSGIPSHIKVVFHADLSDAHPGEDYLVYANRGTHRLAQHTAESRARARAQDPRLQNVPDGRLTHYTEQPVLMPTAVAMRVHLKHTARRIPGIDGPWVASHAAIFVPPPPDELFAQGASAVANVHIDPVSTAKALAFHHPDLISQNPQIAQIVYNYMDNNKKIASQFEDLGTLIRAMGHPSTDPNQGWATLEEFTPEANPDTGVKGNKSYFVTPRQAYMDAAGAVMTNMMLVTKNDPALKGQKWTSQFGSSVVSGTATPPKQKLMLQPPSIWPPNLPIDLPPEFRDDPVTLATIAADANDDDWTPTVTKAQRVDGVQVSLTKINSSTKQFTIYLTDYYLRWLGLYIRFFDADGNTIDLKSINWTVDGEGPLSTTYWIRLLLGWAIEYDDIQFIGYTMGATTILGIPAIQGWTYIPITMPDGAVGAEVLGSGLGTGSDPWPKTPLFGGVMTTLINLVLPAFMLAFATALQSNAALKKICDGLMKNKAFLATVVLAGIGYVLYAIGSSIYYKRVNWSACATIGKLIFNKAAVELLLYVEGKIVVEEAEEAIPFAGWILLALNMSVGIAQLSETIVEVLSSPFNIGIGISTKITTTVNLYPDPQHGAWPQAPSGTTPSLVANLTYKGGKRATMTVSQDVPTDFTGAYLTSLFPNNVLGGQFKIEAYYYFDDWIAGQASTGWMENNEENAATVTLYLVQNPIPLSSTSIYVHTAILTYQNGAYLWQQTATAPTATIADRNTSSSGNAISQWAGVALSQRFANLGFAWKAAGMGVVSCSSGAGGQLYAFQNIDIPGTPMDNVAFPNCGFEGATRLVYDPYPPKFLMYNGNWVLNPHKNPPTPIPDPLDQSLGDYYIDPRNAAVSLEQGGGYHLRMIAMGGTPPVTFDMSTDQPSWGRFPYYPDSITIHPTGAVIAVNTTNAKLSILDLPQNGMTDVQAPVATDFAGQALNSGRAGLLFSPVAVSCSYDGTVLVLESTQGGSFRDLQNIPAIARIQAFDADGNPVNRFTDENGDPSPFLPLQGVGQYTYLDLCAVGDQTMTYMFALYYSGSGSAPSDYHVSIYQYGTEAPAGNPLVTTDGVAASNLFVDMWHTLYTLNYAMVTNGSGTPAGPSNATTGPDGRTVPSVSEWLPPIPTSPTS